MNAQNSTQTKENTLYLGRVVSDLNSLENNDSYAARFKSILRSKNLIEIRCFYSDEFVKILAFDSIKWTAQLIKINKDSSLTIKNVNPNIKLDSVFSQLVENNIFYIPDIWKIGMEDCTLDITKKEMWCRDNVISDGWGCLIEFKVMDEYRRYVISNPETYAKDYPKVNELKNYVNIVELFRQLR